MKHPRMSLSREEEHFLRHWIFDEAHYQEGVGPAKQLQRRQGVPPADLAALIAAAMPSFSDQEAAALGPPPSGPPVWPWTAATWPARLAEARVALAERNAAGNRPAEHSRASP